MLYGKRSLGKTFLALDWACCIALGRPWGNILQDDEKPNASGRVAYLLVERPEGIVRRVYGWLKHQELTPESDEAKPLFGEGAHSFFTVAGRRYAINKEKSREELSTKLEALKPTLVILDPLAFFMDGSENETEHMQAFANGLRSISRACECSVLVIHHEGKTKTKTAGARGSSALEAAMDTVIHIVGNGANSAEFTITKQRDAEEHPGICFRFKPIFGNDGKPLGKFPMSIERRTKSAKPPSEKEKNVDLPTKERHKVAMLAIIRTMIQENQPVTQETAFARFSLENKRGRSTGYKALNGLLESGQIIEGEPTLIEGGERLTTTYQIPAEKSKLPPSDTEVVTENVSE